MDPDDDSMEAISSVLWGGSSALRDPSGQLKGVCSGRRGLDTHHIAKQRVACRHNMHCSLYPAHDALCTRTQSSRATESAHIRELWAMGNQVLAVYIMSQHPGSCMEEITKQIHRLDAVVYTMPST